MIAIVLGLAVGLVLALTGAGGGILAVPLLVFFTGISMAQAAPIGLVAVGLSAGLGAMLGLRVQIVRYRAALLIAGAGMLLAPLGLWLAQRIDNRWLVVLFAFVLLDVAWKSYQKSRGGSSDKVRMPVCIRSTCSGRFIWTTSCARALARTGGAAGLLSGLLGVGGGFVIVPALQRHTDLPMSSTVATSLAVIFLVSLYAVGINVASGNMEWTVALPFCTGTLAGMLGGRAIASRIAGARIQQCFAGLAALVALAMLVRAWLPMAGIA
ncbi:sulfite exporter TauE/SafE family protein [Massilia sp. LjRoot122]|uniref:sulfite exporter TauE/SafE family protein n=1 Tax=Massilia sp. LjRoot122 TaxID=3342257 RepID=UPI003ECFDD37